ncbi:TetR/AcrR family transcriptional regulator [Pseudofrankia inefficax]|uniref:Regulatory protein TetR n=1 Tax=Pseudofrankia inefficax (strain DSM 45817 / CECT 9037 / DDB 130130 / EuI1c) TaxID=298654 RepID=E3J6L1_PSEI1|nr:TetR/AcrR family transcriptional regulator [Pseudofrankia inefficax]ADP80787.1 regulatory protein TetR [Pseudofrankia inefficax]
MNSDNVEAGNRPESPPDGAPAGSHRRGPEDSATRAMLVDAAEQLMLEEGYAAVTTRRVATLAGINPGLVYYYFGPLDNLLLAVFRRGADQILARQSRAVNSPEPLRAMWELASDSRGTALLVEFMALANHRKAIRTEIANYSTRFHETERDVLSRLVEDEQVDLGGVPPSVVALLMASIGRFLVMESAVGCTTSHADMWAYIEDRLRRAEAQRAEHPLPAEPG